MPYDYETSELIYNHYSKELGWLMNWESESMASAFRHAHEIAGYLSRPDLNADSLPLAVFERDTGIEAFDIHFQAYCALDSTVGNLLNLVRSLDLYRNEEKRRPVLDDTAYWPVIPESVELIRTGTATPAWMGFFRRLRDALAAWDAAALRLPTDVINIIALCNHCYVLMSRVHESFSIIEYARYIYDDKNICKS